MDRIQTKFGEVKLISANLEKLCINGFHIPVDEASEYVGDLNVPSEDFMKRTIEKILGKEICYLEEMREFIIVCTEESIGEEVKSFWKIRFEIIEYHGPKQKQTKLVNLRFACTKRDIPFEIKGSAVWIEIGDKKLQVPITIHRAIENERCNMTFNFLDRCLEAIFR